jgi:hypothetical protein
MRIKPIKRWPIIRHVRFYWSVYRAEKFVRECYKHGLGMGVLNRHDVRVLEMIWRGEI